MYLSLMNKYLKPKYAEVYILVPPDELSSESTTWIPTLWTPQLYQVAQPSAKHPCVFS